MLQKQVEKEIKKLSSPLKEGKELELALKAKLTKKELKLLKALATECVDELQHKLSLDDKSLKELHLKLTKKLNYEKTKQALYKDSKNEDKK